MTVGGMPDKVILSNMPLSGDKFTLAADTLQNARITNEATGLWRGFNWQRRYCPYRRASIMISPPAPPTPRLRHSSQAREIKDRQ